MEIWVHGVHGLQDPARQRRKLTHLLGFRHARDFGIDGTGHLNEVVLASCHVPIDL